MAIKIGPDAGEWSRIDILLIHPRYPMPFWRIVPLGCVALVQYLDTRGHRAAVWDCNHDPRATDDALRELLAKVDVRFAGLSLLSSQLAEARRLARLIRQVSPDTRIIAGGQHLSASTADTIPEADTVVTGEGELALERLLGKSGDLPRLTRGEPMSDLDRIPLPDRGLWATYSKFGVLSRLGLIVGRGCPFECGFCRVDGRSRRVRRHSPEQVGELLSVAHGETGVDDVFFLDDVFTLDRDWVLEVCAEIHRRGLTHLRYSCFSHVRSGSREVYRALAQAGFYQIQFGIESGVSAVRRRMRKRFSNEEAREVVASVKGLGMEPHCLYILGYVGETVETMRQTLAFAENLDTTAWFSCAQPFPGTEFFEIAQQEGTILEADYQEYGNERVVYLPEGVTLGQMQEIQEEAERLRLRLAGRHSRLVGKT